MVLAAFCPTASQKMSGRVRQASIVSRILSYHNRCYIGRVVQIIKLLTNSEMAIALVASQSIFGTLQPSNKDSWECQIINTLRFSEN